MPQSQLEKCIGFQWDNGNHNKNWLSHGVSKEECEQIFFNEPLFVVEDLKHSQCEIRHYALGQTNARRKLFIAFTVRETLIRVISARDMSKKERLYYEQENDYT
ncbi:BrnT family toxin [soil metagenome]